MHNLVFNSDDRGLGMSNYLGAFRRTCRQNLLPSVIHVVPTLSLGAELPDERIVTRVAQLRLQAYDEGAQLCKTSSDGRPFDGTPEMAWDVIQGLLAGLEREIRENDYVIFVVGPAETAENSFMRQLDNCDIQAANSPGLPYTRKIAGLRWGLNNGANILVLDTLSFHNGRNNVDAHNADWLKLSFTKRVNSGILFLYSLDFDPIHGDASISGYLEIFVKEFPDESIAPSRVYVVPTSNPDSTLPSEELNERLLHLKTVVDALNGNENHKWHALMFPGVFKGQPETAWSAALLLLKDISQTQAQEPIPIPPPTGPALKRTPPQHSNGRLALKALADLLFKEFRKKSTNSDLDAMIILGRSTIEFTPLEHPERHATLINLAGVLSERFNKEGTKEDLDETITLRRTAWECVLPDDPERQTILFELDNCLYERFRRRDAMADLEEIISLRRVALEHIPPPNRRRQLLSLANSLHEKFRKQSFMDDINEAIRLAITALELCSRGHSDLPSTLDRIASYLEAKVSIRRDHRSDTSSSVSSDFKQSVRNIFFENAKNLPLRLLHTPTGVLCNRDAQVTHFENSLQYKQLLVSTSPRGSQQLEMEICDAISEFFVFAMLSHRWGSREPLLRDVEGKSIYDLGGTGGLHKLQDFCIHALRRRFQWAWSDTCCIDKDSSAELQESIGSMFSWYRRSSLTMVHLSDVSETGSLASSVWFKRGWTLQELLAPANVLFYTHGWSLYMNCDTPNHKTDPALLAELQNATGIADQHLMNFCPGMDNARSRLHWASGRRTTRPEDIAYSLFGIFQVHLPVFYGETEQNALGRLLAEIISRSGDVSVLDWVGQPSSFNSCFPTDLAPYQTVPHIQLSPGDPSRCNNLDSEKTQKLYNKLAGLPRAGFGNSKLMLPSIIHRARAIRLQESPTNSSRYTYQIHASRLTPIEVTLSISLDGDAGRYILVRPWHPKLLETQTESDDNAIWNLLEQLEQPFNALLLKRLPHNEYKRIACDSMITVHVQDRASILDSEVLTLEIV
ncbi:hypothetical protein EDC04DRAFT_68106 [Pisolithus marmoratus]|nr:hypothetical protein EDC04DRAFT_68106 [Pisolithus marmoratus]